jgi:2-polyprenyl-3-methyl-5-hydroxy-6-metoxy-1,4-benzoquinol methylase
MSKHSVSTKGWDKVKERKASPTLPLGVVTSDTLIRDPKHSMFTFSRYKFAAKMLQHCKSIVEVGCGEGFGALMFVRDTNAKIVGIDFDEAQIEYANERLLAHTEGRVSYLCRDILANSDQENCADGLVCLDVIEHIPPSEEDKFLRHCAAMLGPKGVAVFGTPNKHAEEYASEQSKQWHINLFYPDRLRKALGKFFHHVFLFSMNDEIVHTGFNPMAHYLMALCIK